MATIGKMVAVLTAHTKPFEKGMRRAGRATKRMGSSIAAMSKRMVQFGAVAIAAAAAGLALLVRRQLKLIDSLGKLSRNIGVSVADLQSMQLAAGLAGVESEKFNKALKRMIKSVSDAGFGLSTQVRAFEVLGLKFKDLEGLSPDEVFRKIADAVKETGMSMKTTAAIMDIFGTRVGADLVNMLAQGSAGLDEFKQLMKDLGLEMSQVDTAKVEMANDAWLTFKTVLDGIAKKFTVEIAPFITLFSNQLIQAGKDGEGMGKTIHNAIIQVLKVIGWFKDRLNDIEFGFLSVKIAAIEMSLAINRALSSAGISAATERVKLLELALVETEQALSDNLSKGGAAELINAFERIQREAELAAEKTLLIPKAMEVTNDQLAEAAKRMEKLKRAAARVFDATRTPMEKFRKEMELLNELLGLGKAGGGIGQDTFNRAAEAARKLLEDATKDKDKPARDARTANFKQIRSLSSIAIGGTSKMDNAQAKRDTKRDKHLESVRDAILEMRDRPVKIAFA